MDGDIDLVLVALDSSDEAATAAEYAAAIAEQYGADLHLLHVVDQQMRQGLEFGDISAETIAEHHQQMTDEVAPQVPDSVSLSQSSVIGFSENRLNQTPGSVTLDAAEELDADFLVVPRVTPSGATDEVLGKAALYVLEYATQPVLSV